MDVVPPIVEEATRTFINARTTLIDSLRRGDDEGGLHCCDALTRATDDWLMALLRQALSPNALSHCIVYALGGYGRKQLCFQSDLDVLIEVHDEALITDEAFERGIERLMQWVRQVRIKLSHAVRTVEQGAEQLTLDPRTPIALLDARVLRQGQHTSPEDSVDAQRAWAHLRGDDDGITFVQHLVAGHVHRRERHGTTVYLLEPDLKSGPGGLRDLHTIMWAVQVRWHADTVLAGWDEHTKQTYTSHLSWLLWLRNHLHVQHKRKNDRLRFHDQEVIAQHLDDASAAKKPVEVLMRRHYQHARSALHMMERALRQGAQSATPVLCIINEIFGHDQEQLYLLDDHAMTPAQVFEALHHAMTNTLRLHAMLEQRIVEAINTWDTLEVSAPREQPIHQRAFWELLTHRTTCTRTTQRLLDLGILAHMMPEFEPIVCHVQHDLYHVYTTDQHTIYCVEMARALMNQPDSTLKWPAFGKVARAIEDPSMLVLAALTHDIGKNRGGDHSNRGARMAPVIGARLALSAERQEELAFLIREHLCLSNTARRRDISDTRVIRQLAHMIKTVNTLNTLTALTFCDMSTVGPKVMNDWNAALLMQLHQRIKTSIEHGIEHLWRQFEDNTRQKRRALQAHQKRLFSKETSSSAPAQRDKLDAFLRTISTEMIVTASVDTLWHLFETYERCRRDDAPAQHTRFNETHGVTEWIVATKDKPGTLARIAGAMSASGLNILTAELTSTATGHALDFFRVVGQHGEYAEASQPQPLSDTKITRIQQVIHDVLTGKDQIEALLTRHKQSSALMARHAPSVPTEIRTYQDVSDTLTVLEIKATDRPGLLYEIAMTFHAYDINTHFSKIDSPGNTIIDTFYIEDRHGQKLDHETLATLKDALTRVLTQENSTPGELDSPAH